MSKVVVECFQCETQVPRVLGALVKAQCKERGPGCAPHESRVIRSCGTGRHSGAQARAPGGVVVGQAARDRVGTVEELGMTGALGDKQEPEAR